MHAQERWTFVRHVCFSPTLVVPDARSQHLVLLLADWMSAVALQAVFYGKSQSSIQEKVPVNCGSGRGEFCALRATRHA